MSRTIVLLALCLSAVAGMWALARGPHGADAPRALPPQAQPRPLAVSAPGGPPPSMHGAPPPARDRTRAPAPPPRPSSLRGTDVDGALPVDARGRFVPGSDAVAMFEYFLTALGEESYDTVVARITAEIHVRLPEDEVPAALAFLHRYLDYRDRAGTLMDASPPADLRTAFERLRALRREVFGDALAEELFGADERHAEVTIAQREIANDPSLDAETRAELLERTYDLLPEDAQQARRRATAHLDLADAEAALRETGATEDDVQILREDRFGAAAAARLAALDHARAEWTARVDDYRATRAQIEQDPALTAEARRASIAALLDERFSATEQQRVHALDRIDDAR